MTKQETKLKITNELPSFRRSLSITQQKLADEIGVTRATIIAIEKGNYNPSLELAFRLAKFFDTDLESLFSAEEKS